MRHRTIQLLVVLLSLAPAACGRVEVRPDDLPSNLLLVTIDTLRADALGSYGAGHPTPVLDGLARDGTRFTRVYSPAPLTMPAHSTIMTGLLPPEHGVRNNGAFVLPAAVETLAERLSADGYTSAAFVSAAVLEARFGIAQGFGVYDEPGGDNRGALYAERPASVTTGRALAWLEAQRDEEAPFFLWVHYFDPHAPYEPPAPWAESFRDEPYLGEVAATDAAVGRLLDHLRARELSARTLVAVTADHGESLGEHGEKSHALTLYDATQHVPLILAGPGVPKGEVSERLGSLADVAPTLLGRLGTGSLASARGVDLLAAGEEPHAVYAETLATQLDFGWAPLYAARSRTHLYVDAPRPELYADAAQQRNLLEDPEPDHTQLASTLADFVVATRGGGRPAKQGDLDPETRERLRSLGYVIPERAPQATGVDPKDGVRALSAYIRAKEALDRDDVETARREGDASVKLLPSSARPRIVYVRALLAADDPRAALPQAEAAVRLSPHWADAHYWLGESARRLGDEARATAAFAEALRLDPAHAAAKSAQGPGPRG